MWLWYVVALDLGIGFDTGCDTRLGSLLFLCNLNVMLNGEA